MIAVQPHWPMRLRYLLSRFDLARGRVERTGFCVPSIVRQDNNPSVRITVTADKGHLLIHDRAGGTTKDILDALGMTFRDLHPADETEAQELIRFAQELQGGASAATDCEAEDISLRDMIYRALLGTLKLSDKDREMLRGRGFTDGVIERNEYRSLGVIDAARVPRKLKEQGLLGLAKCVPGFDEDGKLPPVTGLLIPCRDAEGRIQSLKVRGNGKMRYQWVGSGLVSLPHHPLPPASQSDTVVVTEGELKADRLAQERPDYRVISSPGVSQWRQVAPLIRRNRPRKVLLAFDTSDDTERQQEIDRHTEEFAESLEFYNLKVGTLEWEEI